MNKTLSRRTFLRMLTGVAAVSFAGGGMSATKILLSRPSGIRLDGTLSYNTFVSLVGQNFSLLVMANKTKRCVRLQLVEVNPVALTPYNDQFNLVFKVFDTKARPNGVYRIQHAKAGSTQLFLQPMDNDITGNYCRAEFNLLT